jgi:putative acetyltransferase
MRIALESPAQPEVTRLIAALDAYLQSLYPPASKHLVEVAELQGAGVLFAVIRDQAGGACGCGAVMPLPEGGEIKRMYVSPVLRGQGAGRGLLQFLEQQAARRGMKLLRLETGIHQPEALRLYERAGYSRCAPFGGYQPDALSVFMEKRL